MDIHEAFDCPFTPESIYFPQPAARGRARSTERALVKRTLHYIASHIGRRVALAEIGRAVGASPAYLTEAFRKAIGTSLYRYQVNLRLARARDLLSGYDDLARLALDLGFSSHSHFTTAFRRLYGRTPAELRRRIRLERK
jgi:AraC family transcriptional regulator